MKATSYLQKQLANINAVFHSITNDLTDEEWLMRPVSGQNMIGYTVWHIPRTQDHFIQTWIRGIPEVFHSNRWDQWQPLRRFGIGAGITLDEADEIAGRVKRADVFEYADAVQAEISAWLDTLHDSDLDQINNTSERLFAFPEYQTPGYYEDVSSLYNQPAWVLLMRPCIGHVHRHLGEVEIAKAITRTKL